MNFNQTLFAGYLGRDPEIRYTPSGAAVCSFSIGSTRKWGEGADKKEETCWLNCVAWSKTGETIAQYCKKGGNIFVTGYLKQEEWTDRQSGQKRQAMKLIVMSFQFIGSPQQSGQQQETPRNRGAQQPQQEEEAPDPFEGDDSQIPF